MRLLRPSLLGLVALALPACNGTPSLGEGPPNFTLSNPSNGAIGITGTPTFTWDVSPNTPTYAFQLSTDIGFGTLLVNQTGIAATSLAPSVTLSPGTVYFWRVFAERPTGNVPAEGSPWSFTTVAPVPGAFTLAVPMNGETGVFVVPSFSWTSSLGTASYHLQVSTDSGFSTLIVDQAGLTATSATSPVTLQPSAPYFWKVLAESTSVVTAAGAPWTFVTQMPPPGSFSMTSPLDGAAGVSTFPSFTWNSSTGATSYRLEVARDFSFSSVVVDLSGVTATSFTLTTPLLTLTTYYWRVTARNGIGSTTPATSAPLSFTTA